MFLGKLPVPGRFTVWMIVWQGSIALAVGAGGVVWTFSLSSILSLLLLPLSVGVDCLTQNNQTIKMCASNNQTFCVAFSSCFVLSQRL